MNKYMLESYARTAASAMIAVWLTGNHDFKALGVAGLAAILGPLMRALDPGDDAFGIKKPKPQSE